MLQSPRRAIAAALLLLAASHVLFASAAPTPVPLADAARHEGQTVRVEGVVREVQWGDDEAWLVLAAAGHALRVEAGPGPWHAGLWVEATGRLLRRGPDLILRADTVQPGEPPPVPSLDLPSLAHDPAAWSGLLVRVQGTVGDGTLHGGGTHIRLGEGPWPKTGRVSALAAPRYDPSCACTVLDAHAVRPWRA